MRPLKITLHYIYSPPHNSVYLLVYVVWMYECLREGTPSVTPLSLLLHFAAGASSREDHPATLSRHITDPVLVGATKLTVQSI
jgi:hypothetical protein